MPLGKISKQGSHDPAKSSNGEKPSMVLKDAERELYGGPLGRGASCQGVLTPESDGCYENGNRASCKNSDRAGAQPEWTLSGRPISSNQRELKRIQHDQP